MRARDVVTGFIVLIVLIVGILWLRSSRNKKLLVVPIPTPTISQKVNNVFPGLKIPAGVEKTNLTDVSGGQGYGIATRTEIVANLPDLPKNRVYQGYLKNSQGDMVLLGTFRMTKSGWLLEYNSAKYPGYDEIIVATGQFHILEGSF